MYFNEKVYTLRVFLRIAVDRPQYVLGIGQYDQDLFNDVASYSDLGRQQHADSFEELSDSTFAGLVIDPLGISCTGGGNAK